MIDASAIYDHSVKIIDDSYRRLWRIRRLPQGSLSTKRDHFYWRFFQDDHVRTKKITRSEWQILKKKLQQRQKLLQMNKNSYEQLKKNVKLLAVFNKELSFLLNDELIAYRLDSIPINERSQIISSLTVSDFNFFLPFMFRKYFNQWVRGKIKARSIIKRLLIKIAN